MSRGGKGQPVPLSRLGRRFEGGVAADEPVHSLKEELVVEGVAYSVHRVFGCVLHVNVAVHEPQRISHIAGVRVRVEHETQARRRLEVVELVLVALARIEAWRCILGRELVDNLLQGEEEAVHELLVLSGAVGIHVGSPPFVVEEAGA
eukprot:CAMPEP_0185183786 /NCGR_PEP_ID=MMETSP1140-20130426/2173_1 /TAXON_ID=298111 /ORGANISM="Pavlova sp., Strain CCMP459" /LENGTH=147 /DNA_ID=CAMNT_0027749811 /DNA_START=340 /DNA_END=779 /DNA_ORIENTATION=+